MASSQQLIGQSNAAVLRLDQNQSQKPRIEVDLKKNSSDAETLATTSSHEEKLEKQTTKEESRQPQAVQLEEKRQQERLREALDKELDDLDLPKLDDQVKQIPRKGKNLDWVPDCIVVTSRDYDDDDDESDNCSLISGLTLPQEITLLRQIADKHHTTHNKKEKKSSSSKNGKHSSSRSSRKTRNKVATSQISSKSADIVAPPGRRNSRPTTDAGDLKPDRAQNMEIEIKMNGQIQKGCYSGALSHTVPRKPNGAGIIKFDNGDMYMGDMVLGEMHGHGTLVNGDTVLRGEFEHNFFVV